MDVNNTMSDTKFFYKVILSFLILNLPPVICSIGFLCYFFGVIPSQFIALSLLILIVNSALYHKYIPEFIQDDGTSSIFSEIERGKHGQICASFYMVTKTLWVIMGVLFVLTFVLMIAPRLIMIKEIL